MTRVRARRADSKESAPTASRPAMPPGIGVLARSSRVQQIRVRLQMTTIATGRSTRDAFAGSETFAPVRMGAPKAPALQGRRHAPLKDNGENAVFVRQPVIAALPLATTTIVTASRTKGARASLDRRRPVRAKRMG